MNVESSGTQSAVLTTEHTLASPSTAHVRVLTVDASALQAGETLELKVKAPVLSGGTVILAKSVVLIGPLSEQRAECAPVTMAFGGTFTLTQTGGTGRSYPWTISTLD